LLAGILVFWIVASFFTKRTVERAGWWSGWWVWVMFAAFVVAPHPAVPFAGSAVLWRSTPTIGIVADILTAAGLIVALWARTILGTNWSSNVVLKEQHELIERGPYRFVRNPMYIGTILALVGAALFYGSLSILIYAGVFFVATNLFVVLYEEWTLRRTFGSDYEAYCIGSGAGYRSEIGSRNGVNGISDIEAKAVRVAASECGQRVSFN